MPTAPISDTDSDLRKDPQVVQALESLEDPEDREDLLEALEILEKVKRGEEETVTLEAIKKELGL